jgi:hypothetical protein
MRKALITLIIAAAFFHAYSQVIVSNDKMNILYAGVDNPISLSLNGYDSKKLTLEADCGELENLNGNYSWRICNFKRERKVVFSCYLKSGKTKKLQGKSEFRLKLVPNPIIRLGSPIHGPTKFFNQFTRPYAEVEEFDWDIRFTIKEYDFEFFKANGDTLRFEKQKWEYSQEIISQIKDLKEGEKFCLKNFVVFNECEGIDRKLKDSLCYTFTNTKPIPQW